MSDKYLKSSFVRTSARPIDALSVITSITTVNTEIPSALRYESFKFYSLSNHKFYHFNQALEPVEESDGVNYPCINCIDWKVTQTSSSVTYYDYSQLVSFITTNIAPYLTSLSGSSANNVMMIRVLPLDAYLIVKLVSGAYTVTFDFRNNKRIYLSYVNMAQTYGGLEFSSLLNQGLGDFSNLDADIDYTTGIGTDSQALEAGTAIRYNGITVVPFVCNTSTYSISKYFTGRIYTENNQTFIYNKAGNIYFGSTSATSKCDYQVYTNQSISTSDWYTDYNSMAKPFGQSETKNIISLSGIAHVTNVYLLRLVNGYYEPIKMDFLYAANTLMIKSKYSFTAEYIIVEYLK